MRRVLVSSICSILLCVTALMGVTWAWFTISIENEGNVIQIGKPEIKLTLDDVGLTSPVELLAGTHRLNIEHANEVDSLNKKSTLYVTLTIDGGATTVYTALREENSYATTITIIADTAYTLSWEASWLEPTNVGELADSTITLATEDSTQSSAENAAGSLENGGEEIAGDLEGETEPPESGEGETEPAGVTTGAEQSQE